MNRRNFLFSSAAVAAPFAAAPLQGQGAMPGINFNLGIATYSFRMFQRDLAIKYVKQLGITHVDVKDFHLPVNDSPKELAAGRKKFDAAGLKVIGGGNINLQDPNNLRKNFEYAKACGFPMMICAPTAETLPAVEKLAIEFNMKMAIHNHGPEDKHFPSPSSVLDAIKNMDPRMGLCIDIGHTVRSGEDVVSAIEKAGPRLFEMHMKDLTDFKSRDSQVPVGDGKIPIVDIFKKLVKINYTGVASLEYEIFAEDPLPGMVKSFAYMRGVLAGIKG